MNAFSSSINHLPRARKFAIHGINVRTQLSHCSWPYHYYNQGTARKKSELTIMRIITAFSFPYMCHYIYIFACEDRLIEKENVRINESRRTEKHESLCGTKFWHTSSCYSVKFKNGPSNTCFLFLNFKNLQDIQPHFFFSL